ncbi:MAG: hypothetical protein ACI9LM_002480 [Alteromonadaceae bacterium]
MLLSFFSKAKENHMIKVALFLALTSSAFSLFAQTCLLEKDTLSAQYQVTIKQDNKTITAQNFTLYRHDSVVAYQYKEQGKTELWQHYQDDKVALNRYFDKQQRGIEYQPNELRAAVNWQEKYQLISDEKIAQMTKVTQVGSDCYQQSEYSLVEEGSTIRLTWLPKLKLIKRLQVTHGKNVKIWQLNTLDHEQAQVLAFFKQKDSYQSTDYADIGDNEDDPFLAKMINQGFIEHLPH